MGKEKTEIKKLIEKIVEELRQIKEVKAVYLFGSQATGQARPYSDIDICVITKWPLSEKAKLEILGPSSRKVYIHFFHELPCYVQFRVLKEGKPLHIADKEYLHESMTKAILRYLDFKPTLTAYYSKIWEKYE